MLFTDLSTERVIRALRKVGFEIIHEGKHIGMSDGFHRVTIPRHKRLNPYTVQSIFSPANMAVLSMIAVFGVIYSLGILTGCTPQVRVAARGAQVMPFDLEQTIHIFQRLDDGGRQTVTAKDPLNEKQIAQIQAHLQQEAEKFRRGDFSDPARIHGDDMPGLAELKTEFGQIDIQYKALPNGGEIRYTTASPSLVIAIHRWFMTQVSDHGRHATDH